MWIRNTGCGATKKTCGLAVSATCPTLQVGEDIPTDDSNIYFCTVEQKVLLTEVSSVLAVSVVNPDPLESVSFPQIRIRSLVFPDPDPALKSTTVRENLTMYACSLGHCWPTDKENQVKMSKKYLFRYIASLKQ
jgi:hypothetical protein